MFWKDRKGRFIITKKNLYKYIYHVDLEIDRLLLRVLSGPWIYLQYCLKLHIQASKEN